MALFFIPESFHIFIRPNWLFRNDNIDARQVRCIKQTLSSRRSCSRNSDNCTKLSTIGQPGSSRV
jgi:hypothetical protein